jgi:hypothetical protein
MALGVLRRKVDAGDREAAFQPRGQYLFEVEPGSGEWLQIGNEYAIRSNGLPAYYRDQVIASVQTRLGGIGPYRLALLAALMRHYQLRVYEPKLEVDETGAQLPSPSLPTITARRLYEQWLRRAQALDSHLTVAQVEAALGQLPTWTEAVPGSSSDAYQWEVEQTVDKRVIKPEFLASEARAAQALERRATGEGTGVATPGVATSRTAAPGVEVPGVATPGVGTPGVATQGTPMAALGPDAFVVGATPIATRYKLFIGGAQHGPFSLEEVAQLLARGDIDYTTRIWNMAWNPRSDKWKTVGDMPELAPPPVDAAIPDPDDGVPDPE